MRHRRSGERGEEGEGSGELTVLIGAEAIKVLQKLKGAGKGGKKKVLNSHSA